MERSRTEPTPSQFLGRRLAYTYEVAEFAPGERLVIRTADGPLPTETSYTWEAGGDERIRMTLRNRGAPSGFRPLDGAVHDAGDAPARTARISRDRNRVPTTT